MCLRVLLRAWVAAHRLGLGRGGLDILTCRSEGEHDGSAVRLKSLPLNKPTHGVELLK